VPEYLRWYVELDPFYRFLLGGAGVVGILALLTGMATENVLFILFGLFWIVGGGSVIWVASQFEDRRTSDDEQ